MTETKDLSRGFPMQGNSFDEASLKSLLEAAKAAGVNLTGIKIEPQPDGTYLVDHDPKDSTGPDKVQ